MIESIKNNVKSVRERIAKAAESVGRSEGEILLVAVSKMQPLDKIYLAHQAGIKNFGENKVQDLQTKISDSKVGLNWHFVGHLQSNKINKIINKVDLIQSVDSLHLLEKLNKISEERGIISKVLLQVNTSGESSKFGFEREIVASACELVEKLLNIEVQGLMTIGPFTTDKNLVIRSFTELRNLSEELFRFSSDKIKMKYLSMGMTGDFELAIKEGSNLVRIGTAIFGSRT
jgi:pyridoxal phosphate enzyme (YggS family)